MPNHDAIWPLNLKFAAKCGENIEHLAHLDGLLPALQFNEEAQANAACRSQLVLPQAKFLVVSVNVV